MFKTKLFRGWMAALLAAGLIAFGIGCSSDDDDDDDDVVPETGVPSINAPADGANIGGDVEMDWTDVNDALTYHLQIATDDGFGDIVMDMADLEVSEYTVDYDELTIGTTYYARVAGMFDNQNTGDWSDVVSFTITQEVVILNGDILEDMTLTANRQYLLRGGVFIGGRNNENTATLTIEPGVHIYGEKSTYGMLVIRRGSQIMAEGTADSPIVMTSDQAEGSRARSDWGGLIVNGNATLNTGETAEGEGGTGTYGGTNDADNSGVIRYVRIEFAGREISPENELNGLALQGVGNGTTVEYVQIHMNKDDGIEFFGGTVNAKYIYVTGAADDSFDLTDGWRGHGQFWAGQQYGDDADQGFEMDSNGEDNEAEPYSYPTVYNFTIVGDRQGEESDIGMLLREGLKGTFRNGVIMNFGDCGLDIDHEVTWSHVNDELSVDYCLFFDNTDLGQEDDVDELGFSEEFFLTETNTHNAFVDPMLGDPRNKNNPDFLPGAGSPVIGGGTTPPNNGFFDTTADYMGAFHTDNWIAGWTTSAQN